MPSRSPSFCCMREFSYRALQWLTRKIVPVSVEGDGSEVQTDRGGRRSAKARVGRHVGHVAPAGQRGRVGVPK